MWGGHSCPPLKRQHLFPWSTLQRIKRDPRFIEIFAKKRDFLVNATEEEKDEDEDYD
jgi:hypothetical protein